MWLVDSSVWIDYFNGKETPQTNLLDGALGKKKVGLGDLMLCEVLQGFREKHDFDFARDALLRFPIYRIGGAQISIKSAENYRTLRRNGITIRKTIDCMIATFAIEKNFPLLHKDKDFAPFVEYFGLKTVYTPNP